MNPGLSKFQASVLECIEGTEAKSVENIAFEVQSSKSAVRKAITFLSAARLVLIECWDNKTSARRYE